jgi:hypothetical protein
MNTENKQPQARPHPDPLVAEGLDYFERAGDEGDKRYVAAIRAALGVK